MKIRGVIVGEVLDFEPTDDGAERDPRASSPSEIDTIPAERDRLDRPEDPLRREVRRRSWCPTSRPRTTIEAGATIERTEVATEVEEVLSDLYPLLRTVQPADAQQDAQRARDRARGPRRRARREPRDRSTATSKRINPQIPALIEDLRLTAEVSDTYADVMPQIAQILDNTVITTGHARGPRGEAERALRRRRRRSPTPRATSSTTTATT